MRNRKKIMGTALAVLLAATMPMTAFAAMDAAPGQTEEQETAGESNKPAGSVEVDDMVQVKGLGKGDVVEFYQVLKWDNGWKWADWFSGMSDITDEDLAEILGTTGPDGKHEMGSVSFELAGKLASKIAGFTPTAVVDAKDGVAKFEHPEAGLYMGIIIPGTSGFVYNPVFVAADFSKLNNTGGLDLSDDALAYAPSGKAKVNKITADKTANSDDGDPNTVDIGEMLDFTVTTIVPLYAENYIDPVFKITDVLSDGLTLESGSVVITDTDAGKALVEGTDYMLEETADGRGYIADFTDAFLAAMEAPVKISVTYQAKVTTDAPFSVNPEDNTVTVNFSNNPNDVNGLGTLRDKTNHYTFDIDAGLFGTGEDEYITTELVKIGVDANGDEIMDKVQMVDGNNKWVAALAGAKFKLYTDADCQTPYVNGNISADTVFESDGNGRIRIQGLDAGDYWLLETEAPEGYIAFADAVHIEIIADIEDVEITENVDIEFENGTSTQPVTYTTNILRGYKILVNGKETANYKIEYENEATDKITHVTPGDIVGNDNDTDSDSEGPGKIVNKIGVALPSTGGIGTTIFYIVGAVLVIGAGVTLVVKKRMSNDDSE